MLKAADGGLAQRVRASARDVSSVARAVDVGRDGSAGLRLPSAHPGRARRADPRGQEQRSTLHNIHSMTTKDNAFNTGQPQAGMVFKYPVEERRGDAAPQVRRAPLDDRICGCLSHPYFAVTDAAGTFKIANVPRGQADGAESGTSGTGRSARPSTSKPGDDDRRLQLHGHREAIDTGRLRRAGSFVIPRETRRLFGSLLRLRWRSEPSAMGMTIGIIGAGALAGVNFVKVG